MAPSNCVIVIQTVCASARTCLRAADLIGRWGGEDFPCAVPGASRKQALEIAERIPLAIERCVREPFRVSISIGRSETARGASDMQNPIIAQADEALYEATPAGPNCVRFAQNDQPLAAQPLD